MFTNLFLLGYAMGGLRKWKAKDKTREETRNTNKEIINNKLTQKKKNTNAKYNLFREINQKK